MGNVSSVMSMKILDQCLQYLRDLNIAFTDIYVPPYVASAFCHYLNILNASNPFLLDHGRPSNLRLHLFMVAPPGYMKSTLLDLFLTDSPYSVLGGTVINTTFASTLTEAGLVGTFTNTNGQLKVKYGLAYTERNSIIGVEEFNALATAMQQKHSSNLDNALLLALDNGKVKKNLAGGTIEYITRFTLWASSQPERFDLTSGLARRLFFLYFIPNEKQRKIIKQARKKGRHIEVPHDKLLALRQHIDDRCEELRNITSITFTDDFDDKLDSLGLPHFEEPLFERLAIGYAASTDGIEDDVLVVDMDNRLSDMMMLAKGWRYEVKTGASHNQVLALLKGRGYVEYDVLLEQLANFGLNFERSSYLLKDLERMKKVRFKKESGTLWVRKV